MDKLPKRVIVLSVIVSLVLSIGLISIPKHEVPTDAAWEAYLEWEQEFFKWRDDEAPDMCVYQIQHRDTREVYFHGSLQECKDNVKHYELTYGECVIMPYLPL